MFKNIKNINKQPLSHFRLFILYTCILGECSYSMHSMHRNTPQPQLLKNIIIPPSRSEISSHNEEEEGENVHHIENKTDKTYLEAFLQFTESFTLELYKYPFSTTKKFIKDMESKYLEIEKKTVESEQTNTTNRSLELFNEIKKLTKELNSLFQDFFKKNMILIDDKSNAFETISTVILNKKKNKELFNIILNIDIEDFKLKIATRNNKLIYLEQYILEIAAEKNIIKDQCDQIMNYITIFSSSFFNNKSDCNNTSILDVLMAEKSDEINKKIGEILEVITITPQLSAPKTPISFNDKVILTAIQKYKKQYEHASIDLIVDKIETLLCTALPTEKLDELLEENFEKLLLARISNKSLVTQVTAFDADEIDLIKKSITLYINHCKYTNNNLEEYFGEEQLEKLCISVDNDSLNTIANFLDTTKSQEKAYKEVSEKIRAWVDYKETRSIYNKWNLEEKIGKKILQSEEYILPICELLHNKILKITTDEILDISLLKVDSFSCLNIDFLLEQEKHLNEYTQDPDNFDFPSFIANIIEIVKKNSNTEKVYYFTTNNKLKEIGKKDFINPTINKMIEEQKFGISIKNAKDLNKRSIPYIPESEILSIFDELKKQIENWKKMEFEQVSQNYKQVKNTIDTLKDDEELKIKYKINSSYTLLENDKLLLQISSYNNAKEQELKDEIKKIKEKSFNQKKEDNVDTLLSEAAKKSYEKNINEYLREKKIELIKLTTSLAGERKSYIENISKEEWFVPSLKDLLELEKKYYKLEGEALEEALSNQETNMIEEKEESEHSKLYNINEKSEDFSDIREEKRALNYFDNLITKIKQYGITNFQKYFPESMNIIEYIMIQDVIKNLHKSGLLLNKSEYEDQNINIITSTLIRNNSKLDIIIRNILFKNIKEHDFGDFAEYSKFIIKSIEDYISIQYPSLVNNPLRSELIKIAILQNQHIFLPIVSTSNVIEEKIVDYTKKFVSYKSISIVNKDNIKLNITPKDTKKKLTIANLNDYYTSKSEKLEISKTEYIVKNFNEIQYLIKESHEDIEIEEIISNFLKNNEMLLDNEYSENGSNDEELSEKVERAQIHEEVKHSRISNNNRKEKHSIRSNNNIEQELLERGSRRSLSRNKSKSLISRRELLENNETSSNKSGDEEINHFSNILLQSLEKHYEENNVEQKITLSEQFQLEYFYYNIEKYHIIININNIIMILNHDDLLSRLDTSYMKNVLKQELPTNYYAYELKNNENVMDLFKNRDDQKVIEEKNNDHDIRNSATPIKAPIEEQHSLKKKRIAKEILDEVEREIKLLREQNSIQKSTTLQEITQIKSNMLIKDEIEQKERELGIQKQKLSEKINRLLNEKKIAEEEVNKINLEYIEIETELNVDEERMINYMINYENMIQAKKELLAEQENLQKETRDKLTIIEKKIKEIELIVYKKEDQNKITGFESLISVLEKENLEREKDIVLLKQKLQENENNYIKNLINLENSKLEKEPTDSNLSQISNIKNQEHSFLTLNKNLRKDLEEYNEEIDNNNQTIDSIRNKIQEIETTYQNIKNQEFQELQNKKAVLNGKFNDNNKLIYTTNKDILNLTEEKSQNEKELEILKKQLEEINEIKKLKQNITIETNTELEDLNKKFEQIIVLLNDIKNEKEQINNDLENSGVLISIIRDVLNKRIKKKALQNRGLFNNTAEQEIEEIESHLNNIKNQNIKKEKEEKEITIYNPKEELKAFNISLDEKLPTITEIPHKDKSLDEKDKAKERKKSEDVITIKVPSSSPDNTNNNIIVGGSVLVVAGVLSSSPSFKSGDSKNTVSKISKISSTKNSPTNNKGKNNGRPLFTSEIWQKIVSIKENILPSAKEKKQEQKNNKENKKK